MRELVGERVGGEGFAVDSFEEGDALSVRIAEQEWDLYVLDVMLPGETSGIDLVKQIRERSGAVPILILSAMSEPSDRVAGLKLGADDYLTKPFEMEELVLRTKGMLKRRSWYRQMPKDSSMFEWANCAIDFQRFEGRNHGKTFLLSQKECMLMKLFVEKAGEVVTRDEILDRVWGYDAFPTSRTVDNFILRLRKLFEGNSPQYFHSVRGVGYKFTPERLDG